MITIYGNTTASITWQTKPSISYTYPMGLDLRPGSTLHSTLLAKLNERASSSYGAMQARHSVWKELDRTLTSYIPPQDDPETANVNKLGGKTEKTKRETILPILYSALEAMLAQTTTVFLRDSIFRYQGTGPEDHAGAMLLEKVVEVQSNRAKHALAIHTMLRDALVYGFGVVRPRWGLVDTRRKVKKDLLNTFSSLLNSLGMKRQTISQSVEFYGNLLDSIDPYCYLPDPSIPIHDVQRSEFVGWTERGNLANLLRDEANSKGQIFNVKYLIDSGILQSRFFYGSRDEKTGFSNKVQSSTSIIIDKYWMYVEVIPAMWDLGDDYIPEKWLFGVAGDQCIISANKVDLPYSKFPVVVCAPEFDGHSIAPVSRTEVTYGIQRVGDFYESSREANVRKVVNDMIVVDPSVINMTDLKAPGPGKIIRTRRPVWGRGVKDAVQQLAVQDVTVGHLNDIQILMQMLFRAYGTSESMQGLVQKRGERISAREAGDANLGGMTRIDRFLRLASIMAISELGYMIAANTQAYMDKGLYIAFTGKLEEELRKVFKNKVGTMVSPSDLLVDFDVISYDATKTSPDMLENMLELFDIILRNPQLIQVFTPDEIKRMISYLARLIGVNNINDFLSLPDVAQVEEEQPSVFEEPSSADFAGGL